MKNSIGSAVTENLRYRQKKLQMIKVKNRHFFLFFLNCTLPLQTLKDGFHIFAQNTHILYILFQLDLTFLFFTKTFLFTNGCMQKKVLPWKKGNDFFIWKVWMMYNEIVYKCKTQKCDKIKCFTISFNAY